MFPEEWIWPILTVSYLGNAQRTLKTVWDSSFSILELLKYAVLNSSMHCVTVLEISKHASGATFRRCYLRCVYERCLQCQISDMRKNISKPLWILVARCGGCLNTERWYYKASCVISRRLCICVRRHIDRGMNVWI